MATVTGVLGIVGVAGVATSVISAPKASATAPGSPGTPQPGTVVYQETFEHGTGATPVGVQSYSGAAAADNESYTADPFWSAGQTCNGWILNTSTPMPTTDPCVATISGGSPPANTNTVWTNLGYMADALGQLQGQSTTQAASNDAVSEYTGSEPGAPAPAPGVELKTTTNAIPMVAGDFYDISADYAAMDYAGGGANCDLSDPSLNFYLLSGSTPDQIGSNLDPCTAPGNKDITVNGVNVALLTDPWVPLSCQDVRTPPHA